MLATFCASLANFLKLPDSDLSLLDVIGEGDENNNLEDDKYGGDSSTTDTESMTTSVATADTGRTSVVSTSSMTSAKAKPKKKEKVAESWEDSDAEEAADSEESKDALGDGNDISKEELERGFLSIYKAVTKLRSEFDAKFRKIFA